MLSVFLLPAFACLEHGCQDLLSPCDGMHVCRDWTSVHTLFPDSFVGMESGPVSTPQENLLPITNKRSSSTRSDKTESVCVCVCVHVCVCVCVCVSL